MEGKEILLSICIPTYNRATYLKICLDSIMQQMHTDYPIEIIVSDNFSTDNTLNVVSEFLNHPCFRLIKQTKNMIRNIK
jgi:glycosyltransferase involved in cell wall biosynthesis